MYACMAYVVCVCVGWYAQGMYTCVYTHAGVCMEYVHSVSTPIHVCGMCVGARGAYVWCVSVFVWVCAMQSVYVHVLYVACVYTGVV